MYMCIYIYIYCTCICMYIYIYIYIKLNLSRYVIVVDRFYHRVVAFERAQVKNQSPIGKLPKQNHNIP